ncbi:MAG: methyltransferase domain-containing protein [bacterium]
MNFSRRAELVEEMDRPDCDPEVLTATLRRFELTNRLFTRYRALLQRHILPDMRRQPDRTYRLTDLGAGGCDIARWLVRVCRHENLNITVRAIEKDPRIVHYARQANINYPEVEVVEADACDPTCWGEPDYLFAQHLLHHLSDAACIGLLKALDQAAPRRFVISDLLRGRTAYYAFRIVSRPLAMGTFIVRDGSASIRRSFLEGEIKQILQTAALRQPVVTFRLFPSRLALVGGKG